MCEAMVESEKHIYNTHTPGKLKNESKMRKVDVSAQGAVGEPWLVG